MATTSLNLTELMRQIASDDDDDKDGTDLPNEMIARRLLDHWQDLQKKHEFKLGDLVQIKKGLMGGVRYPMNDQPGIVTHIYQTPVIDTTTGNGDPGFGRQFDIRVMVMVNKGRVVEFSYFSDIFEPYTGDVADA